MLVHYISPYCLDKNYGKSINEAIERLNAGVEDYVCLTDGDVAFLTPDYGALIHEAIVHNKGKYSLLGCVTNRVANERLIPFWNFEDMDLQSHYNKSKSSLITHGSRVIDFSDDIPGYFMLFPVKIWQKVKFKENTLIFDREFTKGVRMAGGKVGILPGLYVLHLYRIWAKDRESAKHNIKHLIK